MSPVNSDTSVTESLTVPWWSLNGSWNEVQHECWKQPHWMAVRLLEASWNSLPSVSYSLGGFRSEQRANRRCRDFSSPQPRHPALLGWYRVFPFQRVAVFSTFRWICPKHLTQKASPPGACMAGVILLLLVGSDKVNWSSWVQEGHRGLAQPTLNKLYKITVK